ncbi:DNA repair exonuclease [Bacillus sp. DNRA2]|uniref:metallophosphoesterase family protein n=1 Tax=Bacillus sp. DNRA2 TaxID=2723053 RepID=UPI00145FB2BE|nr:DNA repair exonuclease [Bacillus sp. DNRA2]NMD72034.1 DNA repair exonuclease [Bacillus sp. DNRA2]
MKKITFIHAADLHLDSPMSGLRHLPQPIFKRIQESSFTALSKLIDTAIAEQVDFVIFAGDIFDGENRSIRAQSRFRKQIERLAYHHIPVFIVHGNHDHLDGKWAQIPLPPNAYIFPGEVEVKNVQCNNHTTVSLYGFSYPQRHVFEKKIDEYAKTGSADFHIGILHGHYEGSSDHGKYAPFQLSDLLEKQFDYWALGHIHKRAQLSVEPPVIYPGNIQGRHPKESGEKGCYIVTLTEYDKSLEFISLSDILWGEIELDASNATTIADLDQLCRNSLDLTRKEGKGTLLTLKLSGVSLKNDQIHYLKSGELLESLQDEDQDDEYSFVWPVAIEFEEKTEYVRTLLINEADFFDELFQAVDTYENWDESLSSLYQHSAARKFMTSLTETDKEQLIMEVEKLLVKSLKQQV